MTLRAFFKSIFILALGVYGIRGAFDVRKLWLIDGANLLFHEAGHVIFQILGEFMGMLGGTLMQLLIPAGLAIAFFVQEKKYSASVMLFWYGENFFSMSTYVKDAQTQALPLVGGEIHDWNYLLGKLHWLKYDQWIGSAIWLFGFLVVITSMVSGVYFSRRSD